MILTGERIDARLAERRGLSAGVDADALLPPSRSPR